MPRHKSDVVVRWPGRPEPTQGIDDHTTASEWFWAAFPDQHLDNRPYRVFLTQGDMVTLMRQLGLAGATRPGRPGGRRSTIGAW